MTQNFLGLDGFIWFYGVVEDRNDPYFIGRVRVRCFGHHTGNILELPTEDLPWAQVMLPVTSAGISGIGQSPTGLVEGSHVFGFFRDGEARQEPVVMGSLPGYPAKSPLVEQGTYTQEQMNQVDRLNGFADPNGVYPKYTGAPDTSQLAVMEKYNPDFHFSINEDIIQVARFQNIGTAVVEPMQLASAFISKGGGSFFGLVADIITTAVGRVLGSDLLSSAGGALGGFTNAVKSVADGVSSIGNDMLGSALGLTPEELANATINTESFTGGIVEAKIAVPRLPSGDKLLQKGMSFAGVDDVGNFLLCVDSPETMKELFQESTASTEFINNYNNAKARVDAGLGVVEGSTSKVLDPSVLGFRNALGLLETKEEQVNRLTELNNELSNTGGAASQGKLIEVTNRTAGVVEGKGEVISLVEDGFNDTITAVKTVIGDQGVSIPQKNTTTKAGVSKLMNNFIGANKDSWSMPEPPKGDGTYPKRHVYETESGHTMMYDDNDDRRTIQQRHASGSQYLIFNDGTKLDYVVSDHIIGVEGTSYTNIQEDQIVTLNGRYKIFVNKDETRDNNYDIVVGKNANINIQVDKGDLNINILDGRINANCSDNFNMIVGGDTNLITQGDYTINAGGEITLQGDKIFLN